MSPSIDATRYVDLLTRPSRIGKTAPRRQPRVRRHHVRRRRRSAFLQPPSPPSPLTDSGLGHHPSSRGQSARNFWPSDPRKTTRNDSRRSVKRRVRTTTTAAVAATTAAEPVGNEVETIYGNTRGGSAVSAAERSTLMPRRGASPRSPRDKRSGDEPRAPTRIPRSNAPPTVTTSRG